MTDTLFSLGDWEIQHTDTFAYATNATYASHVSCDKDKGMRKISWWIDRAPVCRMCGIPVPDEIQGTLLLLLGDTGLNDKRPQ
jgi:hypothetical protein